MWKMLSLKSGDHAVLAVNTTYLTDITLKEGNTTLCKYCCLNTLCMKLSQFFFFFSFIYKFGEFGTYVINIISSQDCPEVVIHDDPANIYLRKYNVILYHLNQLNIFFCIALLWTSLFIILMLTAWGFKCIIQQNAICCRPLSSWFSSINSSEYQEDLIVPDSTNSQGDQIIRHRIRSLDAFRGYELITLRSQLGIVTTAILCLGLQSFL